MRLELGAVNKPYHNFWSMEQHVKCQAKGNDQQQWQDHSFQESFEYAGKHHNIQASQWKLIGVQGQDDPAQKDGYGSSFPLFLMYTKTWSVKYPNEVEGTEIECDFQPIDSVLKVKKLKSEKLK